MSGLIYREDADEVRDRLTHWWTGGSLGRPPLLITVPRDKPLLDLPPRDEPEGWVTHYSTSDFDYRLHLALNACNGQHYLGEAMPCTAPDLGANCLALYLGCRGVEMPGTVWFEPCIDTPDSAVFDIDPHNDDWDFTQRLAQAQLQQGGERFLTSFPDLIEGLDTLAAMRGTQALLVDLLERPEWVEASLTRITELYFHYYDALYELISDERGGSHFWAWAPGRMAKLQCDFSAMISPDMYQQFMVPVLNAMCPRFDHCMYHWDGPGAVEHLDAMLTVSDLDMIQWTPGAGAEPVADRVWWPLYHRIIDADKKVILLGVDGLEAVAQLQREFGPQLEKFMLGIHCDSLPDAQRLLSLVGDEHHAHEVNA
ncbi:MAG: hypothetical protein HN712_03275 [Gemmatimonadetes bacterium]|jgi:hypothetical protein|nr:hypothetical protein [Gemmatimonadota bacterium]MBT6146866.1 hypothetical protein [Gemmatimonadota bacterium]MBT7859300.1 hypothetical protein [Gemmatimonadota bacterium]